MNATREQQGLANDVSSLLEKKEEKKIILAQCGPGAGKTTTLIYSFSTFEEKNPNIVKDMIENEEKILVVVLANRDKKALEKAIKKKGLTQDLYQITTTHSLFFRFIPEIEKLSKKGISFSLDYTKSKFSKSQIENILRSLCKGNDVKNERVEKMLSAKRIFESTLVSKKNIEIAWALVNGYFGSSYNFSDKESLLKTASFFGKNDLSWEDFEFSKKDQGILKYLKEKNRKNEEISFVFFQLLIVRVIELANMKETVIKHIEEDRVLSFPVTVETNEETPKVISSFTHTVKQERVERESFHIMKVPHSYYTRICYNAIMGNKSLAQKLFKKIRIIVGDEFQDGNKALKDITTQLLKWEIIDGIVGVGDEDQCIYAFSSADHENILTSIKKSKNELLKNGISLKEHFFPQTYRFGEQTATFLNHFFDTKMIGNEEVSDFVSPKTIERKNLSSQVEKISKNGTTAIVCRNNAQCLDMYLSLKENGIHNVRLDNIAREEIKGFLKKGLEYITDAKIKEEIAKVFPLKEISEITLKDMISSAHAKELLRSAGWGSIARLKKETIDNFLIKNKKNGKNIIEIGNPYIMKGSEFDNVIIGDGFFERELGAEIMEQEIAGDPTSLYSKLFESSSSSGGQEEKIKKTAGNLKEALLLEELKDERNILFVSLSRAKKATYFLETPLAEAIIKDFPLEKNLNLQRENDYLKELEKEIDGSEIDIVSQGLFNKI